MSFPFNARLRVQTTLSKSASRLSVAALFVVLYGVLSLYPEEKWKAIGIATLGNTLGGLTSYAIGRIVPKPKTGRALSALQRYGTPALLLSWVPFIGDPLCVATGWLRMSPWRATLFMAIGKLGRYLAIAALPAL